MLSQKTGEVYELQRKIRELEEKIEGLRTSRRVLMNIIELLEKTKKQEVSRLKIENRKLQRTNQKYARLLLEKNKEIIVLQSRINTNSLTIS